MEYNFKEIEHKWQKIWKENKIYKVDIDINRPKFYVLDMFPYPSGAGLHVGHPLGYIASDIYSRYKRSNGYNVLHPMGYDAFGLPAEQYAIQTGQHPAVTTENNIKRYREQLDKIGFSYDWDREFRTSDPEYYKWTQWAFQQMFEHYYCNQAQQARPISELEDVFSKIGTSNLDLACTEKLEFSAEEWNLKSHKEQQEILLNYRLAYLADTMVNWCPALGTVLANDEIKDGVSVRGGHSVEQKVMRQWLLRVSAYAKRLLDGLDNVEWTDSLKEIQRNWIGRSEGANMIFKAADSDIEMEIFTTRADTIFGVTFMVLAPESELVEQLTTLEYKTGVDAYVVETKKRTERERVSDVKKVTGVFTGSYAINPLTNENIPVWVSDYVLAGYGTGAIMAVPGHDTRDFAFARKFDLPIPQVVVPAGEESSDTLKWEDSKDSKSGTMINSGFLNGLSVEKAIAKTKEYIEENKLGEVTVNYRLRDAIFSRQRYWGEPFPVYYKDGLPYMLDKSKLPLELPEVDKYLPTEDGAPPLGRAKNWVTDEGYPLELNTMPGFAGSSAYSVRYMDPTNENALVSKEANSYWQDVDLYIGGTEHATGHLIYSRYWNKFLYDIGEIVKDEPYKKLINQGMIQGRSNFVYRIKLKEEDYLNIYRERKKIASFEHNLSKREKKIFEEFGGKYKYFISKDKEVITFRKNPDRLREKYKNGFDKVSPFKPKTLKVNEFIRNEKSFFVSCNLKNDYDVTPIHVDVNIVHNDILDMDAFRNWNPEYKDAEFILEDDKYICGSAVEKMSKSMYNVVNPDNIIEQYGADTLRLYEMFLGPLEQSKPWDTKGIDGVHKFLRKTVKLFFDKNDSLIVIDDKATPDEMRVLHRTIKKITSDIERFSFNTCVSAFMICVNELTDLKCHKREVLEPIVTLLASFTPHLSEELWQSLGHSSTVCDAKWPELEEKYLIESTVTYPVSFNGKMRFKIDLSADLDKKAIEEKVLAHEQAQKWLEGKTIRKVIVVPKKIVNIVVG